MSDENPHSPLLCPPTEKAEREAANGVDQIDYLTELVAGEYSIADIRESHLLDLQKLAVKGIYPCAGQYRDARTTITISDSEHVPPEAAFVPSHVVELLDYINETRDKVPALERAAYALWRLNWIHPFRGGNGRTSRCLTYLILCLDLKMMLPGLPTLPSLIYDRRKEYVAALKAADASLRELKAKATEEDRLERRADPLRHDRVHPGPRDAAARERGHQARVPDSLSGLPFLCHGPAPPACRSQKPV